jgi:hypothetical protein
VLRAAVLLSSMLQFLLRRRRQACWLMVWEEALMPSVEEAVLKVAKTVRRCAKPRTMKAWQHAELLW